MRTSRAAGVSTSEVLRAAEVYEKLGVAKDLEDYKRLLRDIQNELTGPVASSQSALDCELLQTVLFPARSDLPS